MKHPVYRAADVQHVADVMLNELEGGLIEEMLNVCALSSDEIINPHDFMALLDEPVAEV